MQSLMEIMEAQYGLIPPPTNADDIEKIYPPYNQYKEIIDYTKTLSPSDSEQNADTDFIGAFQNFPEFKDLPPHIQTLVTDLKDIGALKNNLKQFAELDLDDIDPDHPGFSQMEILLSGDLASVQCFKAHLVTAELVEYCTDHSNSESIFEGFSHTIQDMLPGEELKGDCDDYVKTKCALLVMAGVDPQKIGMLQLDDTTNPLSGHVVMAFVHDGQVYVCDNEDAPIQILDDYLDNNSHFEIGSIIPVKPGLDCLVTPESIKATLKAEVENAIDLMNKHEAGKFALTQPSPSQTIAPP